MGVSSLQFRYDTIKDDLISMAKMNHFGKDQSLQFYDPKSPSRNFYELQIILQCSCLNSSYCNHFISEAMGSNCINGSHGFALNYNRGDGIKQGNGFLTNYF